MRPDTQALAETLKGLWSLGQGGESLEQAEREKRRAPPRLQFFPMSALQTSEECLILGSLADRLPLPGSARVLLIVVQS